MKDIKAKTIEREYYDLKPGDEIWFASGWHEVFDAYPNGYNKVTIKLMERAPKCPSMIITHTVRTTEKAICRA